VRTFADVSSSEVALSEKFNQTHVNIKLTNDDYTGSYQEYCSSNDTGPLFDA
jgi:hypothetical protein